MDWRQDGAHAREVAFRALSRSCDSGQAAYFAPFVSTSDFELLEDKPGHLFRLHEAEDARSFLQIGLIAGWDMLLVPSPNYGYAFVSHDEIWEVGFDNDTSLESGRDWLRSFV